MAAGKCPSGNIDDSTGNSDASCTQCNVPDPAVPKAATTNINILKYMNIIGVKTLLPHPSRC